MAGENFPLKKGIFWPMGQKDGVFFVLINATTIGNIFKVKKSDISLRSFFWNTLYSALLHDVYIFASLPAIQTQTEFTLGVHTQTYFHTF